MLSTRSGDRPFERLARTAKIQETIFLGTRREADEALAWVHRLHERIKGTLPEAAGSFPAGSAYSAFDPELMLWTLGVIADSGREMYETLVRPLSEAERDDLWQDYVRFGELFGLPRSEVPATHREFKAWLDSRLSSPELHATEHALQSLTFQSYSCACAGTETASSTAAMKAASAGETECRKDMSSPLTCGARARFSRESFGEGARGV